MAENLQEKREKLLNGIKHFFSDGKDHEQDKDITSDKRDKTINFLKEKKEWLVYLLLGIIIWFGSYIRTKNFWLLKEVTTGKLISVDLDSHIYLKYAKQILENGFLPAIDMTRFVPLGAPTANYAFPAYFIYYLYQFIHFFIPSVDIEYVDVIYPIIAFAIGVLFFFLLVRKLFNTKTALIASFLLAIVPAYLQRTMGGSSDHDALGMMFMFMAMYFFVLAWQSKTTRNAVIWGAVTGIVTGFTGLTWGAWKFLALIFGIFVLIEFFFEKIQERQVYLYGTWLILSVIMMTAFIPLFPLKSMLTEITTAISVFVLLVLVVDLLLVKKDIFKLKHKFEHKIPASIVVIAVSIVLAVVGVTILLGPAQLSTHIKQTTQLLLHPMGKDRWELTVAEQHQPYFTDIVSQFGPNFGPSFFILPLCYILFLIGLIMMFYKMVKENRNKVIVTLVFLFFILAILLSRYSSGTAFDGNSNLSKTVYLGGILLFAVLTVYFYLHSFYKDKETYHQIAKWDYRYIFVIIWVLFMAIAARGAIRLVFVFAPVVVLMAGYAISELSEFILKIKNKTYMYIAGLALLFILLSPLASPWQGVVPNFTDNSIKQATYSGPPYDQQWQVAGKWVRDNVPEDAVFAHWWDYGYWVQNGFLRASVLDGANKVKYWNYLMGRHVLTGENQTEALQFLTVHNATHMLIVSDEIGKYTAYSSIGSDKDYDRYSWITTFVINSKGTQETRNATVIMYQGGHGFDEDFVWEGKVYPRSGAGVGAIFLPIIQVDNGNNSKTVQFLQPTAAVVYQGQRIDVPLQCIYFNGEMIKFDKLGLGGCFRLVPVLGDNGQIDNPLGAGMYVSRKGVAALWTNLYLFDQNNPDYDTSAFKLVYSDTYAPLSIFRSRIVGPIKIWEINYPKGFAVTEEMRQLYLGGNENLPDYFTQI